MKFKKQINRCLERNPILSQMAVFIDRVVRCILGYPKYLRDKRAYNRLNKRVTFKYEYKYRFPILRDWLESAGTVNTYFWQDLWAAQLIKSENPDVHYDIGSRVDGFIGHLACFRSNIVLIDIRPFDIDIPGVSFKQADATNLDGIESNSINSISALCSLEHFGLGRYGDEIEPEACFKAMQSIVKVLAVGGHAYISVPIGWEHLEFNAHRIFFASTIKEAFSSLKLVEFSSTDGRGIEYNIPIDKYDNEFNRGSRFGLFHFVKE